MSDNMAKEYKDHGGAGRVYGSRIVPRIVFAILLITIAFLGYSYWTLLTSHRDTTTKITQMKADLDSTEASRAELTKLMESCKDELKLARQEEKKLKDTEANLQGQVKTLEEAKRNIENEKTGLEEKLKKELGDCQQASQQGVADCNASCDTKVSEAQRVAEETCQQQRNQQQPEKVQANINSQDKQQQIEGPNVVVQESPVPTPVVNPAVNA